MFPSDLIEAGRYYIKVNGQWLTDANANPDRTGDFPVLQASEDVINPQRQEWNINIDPITERYKITNAQDGRYINEMGSFWGSKTANPYDATWHTMNIYRMNGKYAIQTGDRVGGRVWNANGERIVLTDDKAVKAEHFIFEIIPVGGEPQQHPTIESGEAYYIMDAKGRCLTNNNAGGNGGRPTFAAKRDGDKAQLWRFTIVENGRYKLISTADDRYLNEVCSFGKPESYSPDWNTYVLTEQGGLFSIRNAGKGGTNYWVVDGNRPATAKVSQSESHLFTIVKP